MKVLHISHHVGCMRDHAYIYNKLNFDYEFWKFPQGLFKITKDVANNIWNDKKEYFNTFDCIVTSDTAPLSRIFMENISELKPNVVVWICNRFDYSMESDNTFYKIFNNISMNHKDKFQIIPFSDFEKIYCKHKNIQGVLDTIIPIGINPIELDIKIDCLEKFKINYTDDPNAKNRYSSSSELKGKIFIPIYGNDNIFFNIKKILESNSIDCFNGGYNHPIDLKECIGMVTFPDAFCKLSTFETIQNEVIVFLPSEAFIIQLNKCNNNNTHYWFNNPFGYLNQESVKICEWYRHQNCRIYFDSIEDLIYKIKFLDQGTIDEKKKWCRIYGKEIEEINMNKWKDIFRVR